MFTSMQDLENNNCIILDPLGNIYETCGNVTVMTLPAPSIVKQLIEITNDMNCYFHTSLWCHKKVLLRPKVLHKTFVRYQKV